MATKADLEQLFREADVDGSNFLTLSELCVAMKKLGYKGDDAVIKFYSNKNLKQHYEYKLHWDSQPVANNIPAGETLKTGISEAASLSTNSILQKQMDIKAYFAKADASGDNKVSFDEYMKSMSSIPPQLHRAALMRRIFAKFDKDGNGTLNKKELQGATALLGDRFSDEDVGLLMEVLDKDHSETIDMEEFIQAFMNKRRA